MKAVLAILRMPCRPIVPQQARAPKRLYWQQTSAWLALACYLSKWDCNLHTNKDQSLHPCQIEACNAIVFWLTAIPPPISPVPQSMDATVVSLEKGSRVWHKESETSWLLAEISSANQAADAYDLLLTSSGKAVAGVPAAKLAPANPELQRNIPDLIQLSYLNEPSILCDLNERYQEDEVYTNAGPVLIAVNPCKMLPLYTQEVAHNYKGIKNKGCWN